MTPEKCKCGEPHDGWPGNDGGELCQMCWEAQCDKSWWEMINAINSGGASDPATTKEQ